MIAGLRSLHKAQFARRAWEEAKHGRCPLYELWLQTPKANRRAAIRPPGGGLSKLQPGDLLDRLA
jgi:hypothetical protein